ncbi:MAG: hypothetical protein CMC18_00900 [Flavobacteriaceae bacterium]|nr:hypothetical protein [Flavobacteriaceae bacterium]
MIKSIFFSLYTLLAIPSSITNSYEPITFKIDKDTSDEQILVIKDELEEQGINFSYSITRNEKLEITSLSLELKSKNSRSKNTVGSGGNKPIQPFTIVIDPERGSSMIRQGDISKSFNSRFMNMDDMDLSDFDKTIDEMRTQMQAHMSQAFSGNMFMGEEEEEEDLNPLFIIDGREVKMEKVNKLIPQDIESVNVLKGKKALDKYGEKAKYGVVEIKSKSK